MNNNVKILPYGASTQSALRLPPLAKVYKGESTEEFKKRVPSGKGYPADLKYLRVEWNPSLTAQEKQTAQAMWEHLYGAQPQQITGLLLVTGDVNSDYEQWAKSDKGNPLLIRRCDGEVCGYSRAPSACPGAETCTADKKNGCKLQVRLQFALPEFTRLTGLVGSFTLMSHSTNDLLNIMAAIRTARVLLGHDGNVSYRLYRQDTLITQRDGTPANKSLVYLTAESHSVIQALNSGMDWDALPSGDEVDSLPELPASTETRKTATNSEDRSKAWYQDNETLGNVATALGMSAGKACGKLGKSVTDFDTADALITAYQASVHP